MPIKSALITTLSITIAKTAFKPIGKIPECSIIKAWKEEKTEGKRKVNKDIIKTIHDNILKTKYTKQYQIMTIQ